MPRLPLAAGAALLAFALSPSAADAAPVLSIYAGNGTVGVPVAGPALSSPRNSTSAMTVTSDGSLYALDLTNHVLTKITSDGEQTIVAGNGTADPFTPGPARSSGLGGLTYALAVADDGTAYVGDWVTGQIAKITPGGQLSIFAGNGTRGKPVDGPALSSPLGYHVGLDLDAAGNLYFALQDQFVVVKITPGGQLTRIAGPLAGTGGPFTEGPALASDMVPRGGAVLPDGTYFVSSGIPSIARIGTDGQLKIVSNGSISTPVGIDTDAAGNLYVASNAGARITRLAPDGTTAPVAGDMTNGLFSFIPGDPFLSSFFSTVVAVEAETGTFYTVDYPKQIGRIGEPTPSKPRDLAATADATSVTVTFRPPVNPGTSAISGYEISVDGGATWGPLAVTPASAGRLTGTVAATRADTRTVAVRAKNVSGTGALTPTVHVATTATTAAGTPAATPAAVTPTAAAPRATVTAPRAVCVGTRRVTLNWRVPARARVKTLRLTVNGRTRTLKASARTTRLTLDARSSKRANVVITATTTRGATLRSTRTYRLCATPAPKTLKTIALR